MYFASLISLSVVNEKCLTILSSLWFILVYNTHFLFKMQLTNILFHLEFTFAFFMKAFDVSNVTLFIKDHNQLLAGR